MKTTRFWLMIFLLVVASAALHLMSHGEPVPLEKPLKTIPLALEGWRGLDVPLDTQIIKVAGVDDYLYRAYEAPGSRPLLVYIGYYRSQRTGQLVHSPKNCLPGAGWEPVSSGRALLTLPDGRRASVNLYVIENGLQQQLVLYWYQTHGRIIASEYWGKVYMVLDALRWNRTDTALVRITTPIKIDDVQSRLRVVSFAELLLPNLGQVLPK